jgi:nucleoside-diphosphate-sugar epimerase
MVVFGGCGGIGRSLVLAALASDLKVAVLDLPSAIDSDPPLSETVVHPCDASKGPEVTHTLTAAEGQLSGIATSSTWLASARSELQSKT